MYLKSSKEVQPISDEILEKVIGGVGESSKAEPKPEGWKWSNLDKQQQVTYGLGIGAVVISGAALLMSTVGLVVDVIRNKLK